jgi:hypothetical protein
MILSNVYLISYGNMPFYYPARDIMRLSPFLSSSGKTDPRLILAGVLRCGIIGAEVLLNTFPPCCSRAARSTGPRTWVNRFQKPPESPGGFLLCALTRVRGVGNASITMAASILSNGVDYDNKDFLIHT